MRARPAWLGANVVVLSVASFLNDAASEMVAPLMPLFLTSTLGATAVAVGALDGVADAVSAGVKLVAGRVADRIGRNRPLVVGGYALAALARAGMAAAGSAGAVIGLRTLDRVGKGLRSAPRDALLVAGLDPADRPAAFGFQRVLDNAGALVGAGLAAALLARAWDVRSVLLASVVPSILVVALLLAAVREHAAPAPAAPLPVTPPAGLRPLLLALGLFTLGHVGDTLLLLRAAELGAPAATLPLLWVGLHFVKVGAGALAPALARPRRLVGLGWAWCALTYAALAAVDQLPAFVVGFLAYGLYHGLTEGAERALVADVAPTEGRGSAFGWYYLVTGLGALPAGLGIGAAWARWGAPTALVGAAALSALGLVALGRVREPERVA